MKNETKHIEGFILVVENTSNEIKNFNLFGFSQFFLSKNNGNDDAIKIHSYTKLNELICESAFNPFCINRVRCTTSDMNNFKTPMSLNKMNAFGTGLNIPINFIPSKDVNEPDVFYSDREFKVNFQTYLTISLLPNSTMNMSFDKK